MRACRHNDHIPGDVKRGDVLSPRELQVAALMMRGLSNKAMAYELRISQKTIESHRARVYRKMSVTNLVDFTIKYIWQYHTVAGRGLPARTTFELDDWQCLSPGVRP